MGGAEGRGRDEKRGQKRRKGEKGRKRKREKLGRKGVVAFSVGKADRNDP